MDTPQNTHRHPARSVTNPPITGPTVGPNIVPTDQTATALPLSSLGIKSAIVPGPMVIVETPKKPARKRHARNDFSVPTNPQRQVKSKNKILVT